METMRAVVKDGKSVAMCVVPRPMLTAEDQVIIRVLAAGLCRTDIYVAEGQIACKDPLVLGHEFAGVVHEAGASVKGIGPGSRVTAMPVIPCGRCAQCQAGSEITCQRRTMLGIDCHGAFAEFVAVPGHLVYPVPDTLSFRTAAYSEPVAAALAVLNAEIQPQQNGLIYGHNRFSFLTAQILKAHGFGRVSLLDPARADQDPLEESAYDFIIETAPTTQAMAEMVRAVRPFGTIVLKSRQPRPVGIPLSLAVPKELTFRAVHYGPFARAIALLAEGQIDVSDLLGPAYRLEDFARAFGEARRDESAKIFLSPAE